MTGEALLALLIAAILAAGTMILVRVSRSLGPDEPHVEDRTLPGHHGYPCACVDPGRRRLLGRGAGLAAFVAVAAVAVPLWPATRRAERRLAGTSWRTGRRLVDERGDALRVDDLVEGSFTTVWPEGHGHEGDAQTVLIRLRPGRTLTGEGRNDWVVDGHVAYSKVCTHMGCPVGLYQARADLLVCPCHQATYDVLDGARPVHGPAKRRLPQLPLGVDDEGYLVATDDFDEPVGPGYWSRPS